jgi:beta-lactamase class A
VAWAFRFYGGCFAGKVSANSLAMNLFWPRFARLLLLSCGAVPPWILLDAPAAPAQASPLSPKTISEIQAAIQKSGADVAIALRTLDGRLEYFSRADDVFHAASTMKIPVMIELFHQQQQGKLTLEDILPIKNEFHSLVDNSIFKLDATDDSETDLYRAEGQSRTLRQLCELMITVSSNFATNLLIGKLGVANIRATVHGLNADGMNILRGVEDQKAFDAGLNNTTTARGLLYLLEAVADGRAVDAESSREMVEILTRQKFNEAIPAGLPVGTRVAHKTGEVTKIHHDAAIVYGPRPFLLVILVRGIAESEDSAALMAELTRRIYPSAQ